MGYNWDQKMNHSISRRIPHPRIIQFARHEDLPL